MAYSWVMREQTPSQQSFEYLTLPLAESVSPEIAVAAMKRYETRRRPEGLFHSAWCQVEMGLNKQIDQSDPARSYYFDTADMLLGWLIRRQDCHADTYLGTLVLSSYMPLFKKRAYDELISRTDCDELYTSLGSALAYLRPLSVDEPPQWAMTESAVLALSARTRQPELLLYPASPREEHSPDSSVNHDSYFYNNGDKIPLQQKLIRTDKTYADWIGILTLEPLLDKGLRSVGSDFNNMQASDKVNHLLSLIVAETTGGELDSNERKFLNFMSSAVAAHRFDAERESEASAA